MPNQLEPTMVDAEKTFEIEMLARLFQQLTGRVPSEQELKDAQERLYQIKGTEE